MVAAASLDGARLAATVGDCGGQRWFGEAVVRLTSGCLQLNPRANDRPFSCFSP